jgi:hypothetical protein
MAKPGGVFQRPKHGHAVAGRPLRLHRQTQKQQTNGQQNGAHGPISYYCLGIVWGIIDAG